MLDLKELLLRVFISCIVGGIIGFERKSKGKPAGMTTNLLVCGAAAIVAITQQQIYMTAIELSEVSGGVIKSDPTRLIAPVVSGLGFLGAGVIMRGQDKVKGLTTAATLWLTAILGISIGSGYYHFTIPATLVVILCLFLVRTIEVSFLEKRTKRKISVSQLHCKEVDTLIKELFKYKNIKVISKRIIYEKNIGGRNEIKRNYILSLPKYKEIDEFKETLSGVKGVLKVVIKDG